MLLNPPNKIRFLCYGYDDMILLCLSRMILSSMEGTLPWPPQYAWYLAKCLIINIYWMNDLRENNLVSGTVLCVLQYIITCKLHNNLVADDLWSIYKCGNKHGYVKKHCRMNLKREIQDIKWSLVPNAEFLFSCYLLRTSWMSICTLFPTKCLSWKHSLWYYTLMRVCSLASDSLWTYRL